MSATHVMLAMTPASGTAQVQAIGKKYFAPEQQSIVVVGDNAVIEQLKAYGDFAAAK